MSGLYGVCTPACTVFTPDGRAIDEDAQCQHLENLIQAGVHIVAICGGREGGKLSLFVVSHILQYSITTRFVIVCR